MPSVSVGSLYSHCRISVGSHSGKSGSCQDIFGRYSHKNDTIRIRIRLETTESGRIRLETTESGRIRLETTESGRIRLETTESGRIRLPRIT